MEDAIKERIANDIKNNKIMLYMKGTPAEPQCGFSAQVVSVLQSYNIPFQVKYLWAFCILMLNFYLLINYHQIQHFLDHMKLKCSQVMSHGQMNNHE